MKNISILVPKGAAALSCIEGSYTCFTKANDLLKMTGKPALFNVHLVGITNEAQVYDKLFTVYPDISIDEAEKTDLIIIPAVNGNMEEVI